MWFRRNNAIRAAELNELAYMLWRRRSSGDIANKLEVCLENPGDPKSRFIVMRDGKPSQGMQKRKQVQHYIRKFYDNLLYNASNAPDDLFLDSMNAVTKKNT